jgi:hypothetical protein
MKLNELLAKLTEVRRITPSYDDPDIVVVVAERTFPSTPSVAVKGIHQGFDWDNGKLLIYTEVPVQLKKGKSNVKSRKRLIVLNKSDKNFLKLIRCHYWLVVHKWEQEDINGLCHQNYFDSKGIGFNDHSAETFIQVSL